MYLAPFNFIIKHRPGKLNPVDTPSRHPDYVVEEEDNKSYKLIATLKAKFYVEPLVKEPSLRKNVYKKRTEDESKVPTSDGESAVKCRVPGNLGLKFLILLEKTLTNVSTI